MNTQVALFTILAFAALFAMVTPVDYAAAEYQDPTPDGEGEGGQYEGGKSCPSKDKPGSDMPEAST